MKRWKRLTIKTKIMVLYSVLSALLLAVLIPTVYRVVINSLEENLNTDMETAAQNVLESLSVSDGEVFIDEEAVTPEMTGSGIYIRVVCDEDGSDIYMSMDADWAFEDAAGYSDEREFKKVWEYYTQQADIEGIAVTVYVLGSVYYNSFAEDMAWILVCVGVIFFLISVFGSRFIVKRALWPVKRITQTAAAVSQSDRSRRIEGIESRDEVGELARTFNSMLDELETAFMRERQFTSDVSHELRTPLTVIETCVDDALNTENPEIIRDNILAIKKENSRMTKMISQLLFLSRGYEGRIRFEPEIFCLWDMAQSVVEVSQFKAGEKNITIHNCVPEDLEVCADQSLFTQLLVNLADNGIKYGCEGGNVWIEAMQRENLVRIIVRDDGTGISPEDLGHIFERFYRADRARDRSGQGLGLSIVKWIVELHGGEISASSEVDKGTSFCIEFQCTVS